MTGPASQRATDLDRALLTVLPSHAGGRHLRTPAANTQDKSSSAVTVQGRQAPQAQVCPARQARGAPTDTLSLKY